jgi:zinc protease
MSNLVQLVSRLASPARRAVMPVAAAAMLWVGPAAAMTIEKVVSPGGIEAWLVSDDTVPLIAMNFAFDGAGSVQDPEGKEGVANLLSTMLDEGAGDLDSEAFQARLADLNVRLSFNAGRDAFHGDLTTLAENRDAAFELLHLALTAPHFEAEPIARMRTQAISSLRRSERDPDSIAGRLWAATAFAGHPYGRPANGTEATVTSLGHDDLVAFHARALARDNLVIGVVGAIDAETLAPLLDKTFGGLPETAELTPVPPTAPLAGGRAEDTFESPQTVIRFGGPGLLRNDPDFIPAFVMNHILGGGTFTSWLFAEVREKRGLAYSIYTYLLPYDQAGVFAGGTSTSADKTAEVVGLIEAEVRRMANTGPSEQELANAKRFLTGSFPLRFDSSGKIASQLVGMQLDDLAIDYIDNRNALIEAVTLDDLRRVARRILDAGDLTVVTVGPKAS